MKIGIDIDEVLADYLCALLLFHNERYGSSLQREDFFVYRWWKVWGGTREEAIQKREVFEKTTEYMNISPIEGSQEGVAHLARFHELHIVTSRPDYLRETSHAWLEKHFSPFSAIHFANHYVPNQRERGKREICEEVGIDLLIDDSPEFAEQCVSSERRVFLLDTPWNQREELSSGIIRVYSWKEIVERIQEGSYSLKDK